MQDIIYAPARRGARVLLVAWLWLASLGSGPVHADTFAAAPDADWDELFNGRDLSGWTPKITGHAAGVNFAETFRVEAGLLKVRYDGYSRFDGQFGHLFFDSPYSHYALHVEYRFVGKQANGGPRGWAVRNSGVMLHAQHPATMTVAQEFPDSIEAQFLGGLSDGKPRPTANLCTPGTHVHVAGELFTTHCLNSTSATFDGDQWVAVTIVVLGSGTIRHLVNGAEVLTYERPLLDDGAAHSTAPRYLSGGFIALQSESHPIDFRVVRLLNLAGCRDPGAANHRPYAVKSTPDTCRFEGAARDE